MSISKTHALFALAVIVTTSAWGYSNESPDTIKHTFDQPLKEGHMIHFHGVLEEPIKGFTPYITITERASQGTPRDKLYVYVLKDHLHFLAEVKGEKKDRRSHRYFFETPSTKDLYFALRFTSDSVMAYLQHKLVAQGFQHGLQNLTIFKMDYFRTKIYAFRLSVVSDGGFMGSFKNGNLGFGQNLSMFVKPTNECEYQIVLRNEVYDAVFALQSISMNGVLTPPAFRQIQPTGEEKIQTVEGGITCDEPVEIIISNQPEYLEVVFNKKKVHRLPHVAKNPASEHMYTRLQVFGSLEIYDIAVFCGPPGAEYHYRQVNGFDYPYDLSC